MLKTVFFLKKASISFEKALVFKASNACFGSLLVFPGQGVQRPGMINPYLTEKTSGLMGAFDQALGYPLSKYLREGPQETLNQTEITQPAVFVTSYLSYLTSPDPSPSALIGHSVGEYTALAVAGFLDPLDAVMLLKKRGQLMQAACEGKQCGMLVVTGRVERAEEIRGGIEGKDWVCQIAVFNSRKNHVYSGEVEALKALSEALKKEKISCMFLKVSAAFHCSLMSKIQPEFRLVLEKTPILSGRSGLVLRNCDLKAYVTREDVIDGLVRQLVDPVLFYQSIERAIGERDIQIVKEYGGKGLSRVLKEVLEGKKIDILAV